MMDCLFCKIIAGEIPCTKVYEDEQVLAFRDIAPKAPIHVLVIPKTHVKGIHDAPAALTAQVLAAIPKVAEKLNITEYRVVANNGETAGQTVFHLHFHLLAGGVLGEMC